jgi:hypothetical protein
MPVTIIIHAYYFSFLKLIFPHYIMEHIKGKNAELKVILIYEIDQKIYLPIPKGHDT